VREAWQLQSSGSRTCRSYFFKLLFCYRLLLLLPSTCDTPSDLPLPLSSDNHAQPASSLVSVYISASQALYTVFIATAVDAQRQLDTRGHPATRRRSCCSKLPSPWICHPATTTSFPLLSRALTINTTTATSSAQFASDISYPAQSQQP